MTDQAASTITRHEFTTASLVRSYRRSYRRSFARPERNSLNYRENILRFPMFNIQTLLIIALAGSKLRDSSIVLNTRKFRNVIYSSSMSNEMSTEISASSSFNYKFSESRHCRATMYYNPSWSLRTVIATTSFCYFRIAGTGGPYVSRQNFARFR